MFSGLLRNDVYIVGVVMICWVCGNINFVHNKVLWDELIELWGLSADEANYIDKQQGTCCSQCGSNIRSIALAKAITSYLGGPQLLKDAAVSYHFKSLALLEINHAGNLSSTLSLFPKRQFASYPDVDMQKMTFPDESFDLVVHSDTLEHIENPITALKECYRILKPEGAVCFTVPIVVGRLSRDRKKITNCYHGPPNTGEHDMLVHSEFGADVWCYLSKAGFDSITFVTFEYPSGIAILGTKGPLSRNMPKLNSSDKKSKIDFCRWLGKKD